MIIDRASMEVIDAAVAQSGFKTLKQDAKEKILAGITTVEMAMRSV
jgi:type II secretory ATPase GspE/PulE/Tfp pilus assembly ATPase PilB-like protein